jgi:hypothetical protein
MAKGVQSFVYMETLMKSLSMTWTSKVDLLEIRFALAAVQEVLGRLQNLAFYRGWLDAAPDVNVYGDWYIPSMPEDADYQSLQWYVEQTYDRRRDGVSGKRFLELVVNEPWQRTNPHFDLCLVGEPFVDLATEGGALDALALLAPGEATVISLAPLRAIEEQQMRLFAVRRIVAHQLGHLLDIPRSGRDHALESESGERHCVNLCAMSLATDMEGLVQLALAELDEEILLCDECWEDAVCRMTDDYFGIN